MPGLYCAVYGCSNSASSKPELSYFKLPSDSERRSEWLRLISREDLMNKPPQNFTVCEIHFNPMDILKGTQRNKLKSNSLPSLHLPEFLRKDVETSTDAPELVEICTQTEDNVITSASDSCRTFTFLSSDTQRKRKLQSALPEYSKRFKINEVDNETGNQRVYINKFNELCDKFLTSELAVLAKAQTHIKCNYTGNRYDEDYKMFCLNLYYNSPQAYRLLQNIICLPSPGTLNNHGIPVTSEINDRLLLILKTKVDAMNEMEKNCSVVIGAMSLKANLLYNVKEDKIIGFHEVDGVQSPEPAKNALVVMVHGIFNNWKQPVGFALLSECRNNDEIAIWIDKLLEMLFEIGLNIRTFVSDTGSDLLDAAKKRSVTIEQPYFFINERKIYYIFDAPHLIKLVRDNLISYDFHFQDRVAKYEHIVKFYENDKQKSFKLAHKLTDSHIHPKTNLEKNKVRYATELLSNSVAVGISNYVDFNHIEESGRGTAVLIRRMNNIFDSLNSSSLNDNCEYRRAFCGKESQITFFNEMLTLFQQLQLINPKNGENVTSSVNFIYGFQITITSILMLFEDLQSDGCTFLPTKRLNQEVLGNFFEQIRTKGGLATEPTSREFINAFQKNFFSNIIKPPKEGNWEEDLGNLLSQISWLNQLNDQKTCNEEQETPCMKEHPDNIQIMSSEYNQIDINEENSLFYVCSFLLKKCGERHNDCQVLKSYMKPNQATENFSSETGYTKYREYSKETNRSLLVVPPDDFVQYIEKIDEIFRCSFKKEHINCKIGKLIYKEINKVHFILPCPCFPTVYLKKLFIRLRIFNTIKCNNTEFKKCRSGRKYFTVSSL